MAGSRNIQKRATPSSQQPAAPARVIASGTRVSSETHSIKYSGPLPPPVLLGQYDQVLPGCAERIVQLTEKQSSHRQELEALVIRANIRHRSVAMWLSFVVMLVFGYWGYSLILQGHSAVGLTQVILALLAPASTSIHNAISERKERLEKTRILAGVDAEDRLTGD